MVYHYIMSYFPPTSPNKMNKFILFIIVLYAGAAYSDDKLPIVTSAQSVKVDIDNCAVKNLTRAYQDIGYQVNFPLFSASRSLIEANHGRVDAETARIAGIEKDYPNLVRIPVVICRLKIDLYANNPITLEKINALQNYELGYRAGNITLKRMLKPYSPFIVTTYEQLLKMLQSGRLDMIAIHASTGRRYQKEYGLHLVKFDLPQVPLYHYVHKKNSALIPKLTASLKALEKSGFTEKTIQAHQKKLGIRN